MIYLLCCWTLMLTLAVGGLAPLALGPWGLIVSVAVGIATSTLGLWAIQEHLDN